MLFRIVKINFIKERDVIALICETDSYESFSIEISNLDSEIAFEVINEENKDEILKELTLRFSPFRISEIEWKEYVFFDRESSEIKHCMAFVVSWNGMRALESRRQGLDTVYPSIKHRTDDFIVHGYNVDPVELMIRKLYSVMHNLFSLKTSHGTPYASPEPVKRDLSKPIQMTCQDLLDSATELEIGTAHWFVLTLHNKNRSDARITIEFNEGLAVNIHVHNSFSTRSLGRSLFVALKGSRRYTLGFVEEVQAIYNLLHNDPYLHRIFANTVIVEKRSMPFYMSHDEFNKVKIYRKIVPYSTRLASFTKLPLGTVLGCTTGAKLVDVFLATYMSALHGIVVPPHTRSTVACDRKELKGGFITTPVKEIIKNCRAVDIDYQSFYPSIIKECNLDFKSSKDPYNILPAIVEQFIRMRSTVSVNEGVVLKFIINNIYGTLGYTHSRFYCHEIASAITEYGRAQLQEHAMPIIQQCPKFRIIFANTDGLLLQYMDTKCSDARYKADAKDLCTKINAKYSFMKIHPAAYYTDVFIYATNNYICKDLQGQLKMKGIVSVHKSSPAILKSITNTFVEVMLDDIRFPQGTKIYKIFQEVKRLIAVHKTDPDMWSVAFTVDKFYNRNHDTTDPQIKLAVENNCLPGEVIRWMFVTCAAYEACSESYPPAGPFPGNRTFYQLVTAVLRKNFDTTTHEINIYKYVPIIVKCLKYLCSIYTAEPSCEITEISFINDFHPAVHDFSVNLLRSYDQRSYVFSQSVVCNYCRKMHTFHGFSQIIEFLLRQPSHDRHVTTEDLIDTCTHCQNSLMFWECMRPMMINYFNARPIYFYTSIISLLNIAHRKCKVCYQTIYQYKDKYAERVHAYERHLASVMSDAPNTIPVTDNLASTSQDIPEAKRIRIR